MAAQDDRKRLLRRMPGRLALTLLAALLATPAAPAVAAKSTTQVIVLPGARSAEGITAGHGNTFYAGDLFAGDIYIGNVRRGTARLLIDAPDGRMAAGMDYAHGLLFVAGAATGQAYVYNTRTGATVATYQFAASGSFINDVTVTRQGAWFTDSLNPRLFFVPFTRNGQPAQEFRTLTVTGPAAALSGDFNFNGITATPNGRTLIVAHTGNAALYLVDPRTGASTLINGVSVPNVDGIELRGRTLWAVQNFNNQVSRIRLNADFSAGVVTRVITSDAFQIPTTAALFGNRLAVVNAKFDTGFPPTATQYEVVVVRA